MLNEVEKNLTGFTWVAGCVSCAASEIGDFISSCLSAEKILLVESSSGISPFTVLALCVAILLSKAFQYLLH